MIRLFQGRKRVLFFPKGWANSVTNWILGVHSPSGTIKIVNTANPGENKSASLDVDVEQIARLLNKLDFHKGYAKESDFKTLLGKSIDGSSLVSRDGIVGVSDEWLKQRLDSLHIDVPDNVLTDDDIGVSVCSQGDYESLFDDVQTLADDVDSILADYLTSLDVGVTVAAKTHTHGNITSDGRLNGCTSNDCLLVTGAGGVITHSNSNPKASDIASLVSQWIENGKEIGGGEIDHTKISDWETATAGFLDTEDYNTLADAIGDLADMIDGCLFTYDIGVTVAAQNHTHTTANITDWSSATSSFVTDSELAGYALDADLAACENAVADLSDIVDSILADYVKQADLDDFITTDEIPANFLTAIASRKSGTFTFLNDIQFNGTALQKKTQTVTVTQGVVTNIAAASGWTTWHTPTVITWA